MFYRHGSLVASQQNHFHRRVQILLLVVVLMSGLALQRLSCFATDRASVHVQAALQSELNLNAEERAAAIESALRVDPDSAGAHWARGDVRVDGQWLSLDESAEKTLAQPHLLQYWERRAEADDSVAEQMRLAEFCRANRMTAQERAHLNAVVALEPNHREARKKLGQVKADGMWVDRQQVEQQKKKELATAAYLKRHADRLMSLSIALNHKSKSEERVLKELCEFGNPMVIPGLEYFFSSTGESGGLCTVEAVATLTAPEASLSLARHALDFPDESVRLRATRYLKQRDEVSFVPALLGELQTRIEKVDGFEIDHNNDLVWRQRFLYETQYTKRIATLDRVYQFPALVRAPFNSRWARGVMARAEADLEAINVAIDEKNEKIIQLITMTTEDRAPKDAASRKTPDDWWNWWNDRIECYPADEKPTESRYEASYTTVNAPRPTLPPPRPPRYPGVLECLAAGTPIWTETGLVDIDVLKVGDMVLTQNQQTGELKFAPVLATTTRPPEKLLRLTINKETIRATGGHPFWVSGRGWIKARSLEPGMGLHTARGFAVIDSIEEEIDPAETFNLIVDECHSYFVGKQLILSHDNTFREPVLNRIPGLYQQQQGGKQLVSAEN